MFFENNIRCWYFYETGTNSINDFIHIMIKTPVLLCISCIYLAPAEATPARKECDSTNLIDVLLDEIISAK